MRSLPHARRIAGLLGLFVTTLAVPAAAQNPSDTVAARELFIEGSALSREGKWMEARDRYERSLVLKKAAITLYSLGVAQKETGQLVEALSNFRAFLTEPSDPATKPFEAPAKRAIEELNGRVAELSLTVEPPDIDGLRITIDAEEIPMSSLGAPRVVNPGAHHILAEAPGFQSANSRVTLDEGAGASLQLRLVPGEVRAMSRPIDVPPPPPSFAEPPPQTHKPARNDRKWLSYALIGGGTASLAAGAALGIIGISQSTYASDPDGLEQESARDKAMVADLFGAVGIVGISVGVVLLISAKPQPSTVADRNGVGLRF